MKFIIKLIIILILLFSLQSCGDQHSVEDVEITITEIKQTHYEFLDSYGHVEIYYKIKNIGNIDIYYYKIYFKVTCYDGSTYIEWDNGLGVKKGMELSDKIIIDVGNKIYSKVEVIDKEL